MDNIFDINDISEFIIIPPSSNTSSVPVSEQQYSCITSKPGPSTIPTTNTFNNKDETNLHWTKDHSLILIDCYKMFRSKVGGMAIRNLKKMWDVIATYIFKTYKLNYTATNCENRWRVLERNYKKYIENNSQTGRGRRYFEFADEMDAIFKKKRNINPEILLTSSSTITNQNSPNPNEERLEVTISDIENVEPDLREDTNNSIVKTPKMKANTFSKIQTRIQRTKYKKDSIIEQMRLDRKRYQEERLKMEKFRIDQMLEIDKEKLEIRRKRNELLEKKNNLIELLINNKCFDNLNSIL